MYVCVLFDKFITWISQCMCVRFEFKLTTHVHDLFKYFTERDFNLKKLTYFWKCIFVKTSCARPINIYRAVTQRSWGIYTYKRFKVQTLSLQLYKRARLERTVVNKRAARKIANGKSVLWRICTRESLSV